MISTLVELLSSEDSQNLAKVLVLVLLGLWTLRTLVDVGLRVYRHRLARKIIEGRKDMRDVPETLRALRLGMEDGDDGNDDRKKSQKPKKR
jgi:hypothetical protein